MTAPTGRVRARPVPVRSSLVSISLLAAAALSAFQLYRPQGPVLPVLPVHFGPTAIPEVPAAAPTADAFGKSGEVRVRFALPGEALEYPLEVSGDPYALQYQWVRLADSTSVDSVRPLTGANVVSPSEPGFYQLALVRGPERRIVDGLTLGVLVPFSQKLGGVLNGYRIGTYLAEQAAGEHERPEGFVQVDEHEVALSLTKHLRLGDFITHDTQQVWPRYAALNPRLLDKLELVVSEVAAARRDGGRVELNVDVHSGFRSPIHNRDVRYAASDSRHQYGDAADVTIDADGDGRITARDTRRVAAAVEEVERKYPDLVGGMGLYTSGRHSTPYVHIDARGRRARWNG